MIEKQESWGCRMCELLASIPSTDKNVGGKKRKRSVTSRVAKCELMNLGEGL
jgi:hypothetical protein